MPRVLRRNIEQRRRRQLVRNLLRLRRVGEDRPGLILRNPETHSLGEMNGVCRYCYATYFGSERNSRGLYTACCHNGKVALRNVRANPFLKDMLTGRSERSTHFKMLSRNYNNAMAMVSTSGKIKPNRCGPYVFIVNGQVHHKLGITQNIDDSDSRYAQIYFFETGQAARMRQSAPYNTGCELDFMRELTDLLMEINPYAQAFKTMGDILRETPQDQQQNVRMVIYTDRNRDQRRYNLPTANDVAAVFKSDDGSPEGPPEFVVYPKNGFPENLPAHCSGLDPMAYPLLFPYGEEGWFRGMPQVAERATRQRNNVTQLQFAAHRLSVRNDFSPIIHGGKLFLQYIVDLFTRIEGERLAFVRREQGKLRAELYMNLHDAIRARAEDEGVRIGRQVILPKSFQGSFRNLHSNYLDAMAIVRHLGKPDLFITFTCNPNWDEIKCNLKYDEPPHMRPDLIVRVFHEKLNALLNDIRVNKIFGTVLSIIYTIEFQKRGLPHAHILIILDDEDTLRDAETIDLAVWAEIPSQNQYPELHEIVTKHMIHGPCGTSNPNSPCMVDGKCTKSFPKPFLEETKENVNGYPLYRRRNDGHSVNVRGNLVDNRYVVPYNPFLLKKFNAHINVEICSTVKSVKYIYKYIYKGYDAASIAFQNGDIIYDEVDGYLNARWVGSAEAMWRILEYPMHFQSHTVINLECHLENQQRVTFVEGNEERALEPRNTKLMAWFRLNQTDESSRDYSYCEIPKHYTWQDNGKVWRRRVRGHDKVIARLNVVSPKNFELFHLRLLLLHVKGAQNFQDIRTYNGHVYETYREAAIARGLAESSQLSRETLQEAVVHTSPNEIRNLFAWLLGINVPTESANLWEEFKNHMIEDFQNQGVLLEEAYNRTLIQIEDILITHNTSCRELGLPAPIRINQIVNPDPEDQENKRIEFEGLYTKANEEQKRIIDLVIFNVQTSQNTCKLFYLDAPAGCGKTFIQKTLLAKLKSIGMVVLPVAFTGIAASLIEGGRTLHNQFKLPIPILENSVSGVTPNSPHGEYLNSAKLIMIDEISMTPSAAITVIDRLFRDLTQNQDLKHVPFAGKVVLFSGDFRQTLPVVPHAGRNVIIENCLKNNRLWPKITKLRLEKNMRLKEGEEEFARFLLQVGNDSLPKTQENMPILPEKLFGVGSPIDFVYGSINEHINDVKGKGILAPKNSDCDSVNNEVLSKLPGNLKTYESIDSVPSENLDAHLQYPTEFLNSIEVSGLPKHKLSVKSGAVVLLMRNLNTEKGLINGTRLQVLQLFTNSIQCRVMTGTSEGETILIPRIKMTSSDTILPFKMQRHQFPLSLAFCMTINKAQGQSLNKVAIYLPKPVFTHGQLYVALSRSTSFEGIKIYLKEGKHQGSLPSGNFTTTNVVFQEIINN